MSKYTDFIHNSPVNAQSRMILDGINRAYENADPIGNERSSITGVHELMLSNVDSLADRLRGASTDLMETLMGITILEFCDFNTKMGVFMNRLMQININEKRITLNSLGRDAHYKGMSDNITAHALRPSYVQGMNYLDYATTIHGDEVHGTNSTQKSPFIGSAQKVESPNDFDYGNLYPDDLNQGDDRYFRTKRWFATNQNSLLYKTKNLFRMNKINTLISRFGTQADSESNKIIYNGSKRTVYGESHGRNLLKAGMEVPFGGGQYVLNGYNNPYCRVWTHHYQYNQLYKTIRPFSVVEYDDNTGEEIVSEENTLLKFHKWKGFEYTRNDSRGKDKGNGFGWKHDSDINDWDKSVLSLEHGGDGILKIAPKYINSRDTNIHTKDCMFSIENLAWRGYDPYSFEKALSWEQRGPLGGRIMWFPPYGITFNETTNVNWSSNTFIGRGEDVYTYINTVRSGTLSFLMVVDHPSILNYISWYDDDGMSDEYTDTDLMRFFAGCDSLDPNDPRSIMSRVKPTPLTDEYLENYVETPDPVQEQLRPQFEPPEIEPETKKVVFYAFYPNNYSGCFDMDANFTIAYLLAGCGCQKIGERDMTDVMGVDFNFKYLNSSLQIPSCPGYEITRDRPVSFSYEGDTTALEMMQRLDSDENFIYGYAKPYDNIPKNEKKRWYYRVDGEYKTINPKTQDLNRNTYGQKIIDLNNGYTVTPENTNYCDTKSYMLNSSPENWGDFMGNEEDTIYCTLNEIAAVVADIKGYKDSYEFLKNRCLYERNEIINEIKEVFETYKLIDVTAVGFSNIHGTNPKAKVNKDRNINLATERGNTIIRWLQDNEIIKEGVTHDSHGIDSHDIKSTEDEPNTADHSSLEAKKWRSTKVTLTFQTNVEQKLAEMKAAFDEEQSNTVFVSYPGFNKVEDSNGNVMYKDKDGRLWIETTNGNGNHELMLKDAGKRIIGDNMRGASQDITQDKSSYDSIFGPNASGNYFSEEYRKYGLPRLSNKGDKNVLRYDQEYYFFRALKKKDPLVFNKLMDKIKYFDPAFHSMTPEGFNARLTFLNQCTRQGNTVTMSDVTGMTANNLAFGRPPFCVLRLGDFYNQLIVIENVNIDYDVSNGIQWDMNTEGIGMQPLLARVNISFKFIGGSDIAGPIRRLQNAMTFNYYANTRFYDNRADRMYYLSEQNSKEIGGANQHEVDLSNPKNYVYNTKQYNKK